MLYSIACVCCSSIWIYKFYMLWPVESQMKFWIGINLSKVFCLILWSSSDFHGVEDLGGIVICIEDDQATVVEPPTTSREVWSVGAVEAVEIVVAVLCCEFHSIVHSQARRRIHDVNGGIPGESSHVDRVKRGFTSDGNRVILGWLPRAVWKKEFESEAVLSVGGQLVQLFQTQPKVAIVAAESIPVGSPSTGKTDWSIDSLLNNHPTVEGYVWDGYESWNFQLGCNPRNGVT